MSYHYVPSAYPAMCGIQREADFFIEIFILTGPGSRGLEHSASGLTSPISGISQHADMGFCEHLQIILQIIYVI